MRRARRLARSSATAAATGLRWWCWTPPAWSPSTMRAASARAAPADSPPRSPRWPTNADGAGLAGPQQVGRRFRDALRAGRLELFSAMPSPSHAERRSAGEARFAHVAGRVAREPVARLPREPRHERLDLGDLACL